MPDDNKSSEQCWQLNQQQSCWITPREVLVAEHVRCVKDQEERKDRQEQPLDHHAELDRTQAKAAVVVTGPVVATLAHEATEGGQLPALLVQLFHGDLLIGVTRMRPTESWRQTAVEFATLLPGGGRCGVVVELLSLVGRLWLRLVADFFFSLVDQTLLGFI